jgi:hypothetical protein
LSIRAIHNFTPLRLTEAQAATELSPLRPWTLAESGGRIRPKDLLFEFYRSVSIHEEWCLCLVQLLIRALDGGGVRGYSIFIIIQELMHRTFVEIEGRAPKRHEIPKPCDHFDLIVGTGTGGLIALMLGRLRLDLETCKELYVRMTRTVFQTDKTIAGIPYRSTLFKASKLEEAIKTAVQEHTVKEREGNDSAESPLTNPLNAASYSSAGLPRRNQSNASTVSFSARSPASQMAHRPAYNSRYGDPNARLYDHRENRTKT